MSAANRAQPAEKRRAAGFGMVEAMVSIFISLLVILAITGLYVAQKGVHHSQETLSGVQENGRFLMQVLTHGLRQAGYRDVGANAQFPVGSGQGAGFIEGDNATRAADSDSLTVRFFGASNTQGQGDGSILDCHGAVVERNTMVTERYFIKVDPQSGEPGLYCGIGATALLLVSGVESMQLLFGAEQAGAGGRFGYQAPGLAPFDAVQSVLVSVIVRSASRNNPKAPADPVFHHFGATYPPAGVAPGGDPGTVFTAANDGRLRRHFTFTVGLRNRLN